MHVVNIGFLFISYIVLDILEKKGRAAFRWNKGGVGMEASEGCKELGEGRYKCRLSILNDYLGHTMLHLNATQGLTQWPKTADVLMSSISYV
jgi:hypothetical protein